MAEIIKVCAVTNEQFTITEAEQEHIRKFESLHPLLKTGDLPLPTIHPLELMRQMQSFVSLTALYNHKSFISEQDIITRYHPALGYKVCSKEEFWSDQVDNREFGREYDFSRSFFVQWQELMQRVYMQPLVQINCHNSPYVDSSSNLKDCYMCFGMGESEDCFYCIKSRYPLRNKNCVDCVGIVDSQYCYSCVDCEKCYECQHCLYCYNSSACFGSVDLIGCTDCFGCVGLRQKKYCVFNKQYSAAEYKSFLAGIDLGDYKVRQEQLDNCINFIDPSGHIANTIKSSEESSGSYLYHCKNAYQCFRAENLEDCGWSTGARGRDGWRAEMLDAELAYNSVVLFGRLGYGNSIHTGSENFYSYMIFNSDSCFGCTMLKRNSYCILNKQYSREEYHSLVPRIIAHMKETGEWGQFLPPQFAPHPYQDSQSATWFKLITLEEAKRRGYRVEDVESTEHNQVATMEANALPSNIQDVVIDGITSQIVSCAETKQLYRFDKREVEFYQKQCIPLPRVHWKERLRKLQMKYLRSKSR